MSYQSINPYNGETLEQFEYQTDSEIFSKLESSKLTYQNWRSLEFTERAQHLTELAIQLESNSATICQTIHEEMGKSLQECEAEVAKSVETLHYYAKHAETLLQPLIIQTDYQSSTVYFHPLGPILGVMPWNFPLWQVIRFAAPTLMAGNTVLLKHAENVPRSALLIETLFNQAGFPKAIFQNLFMNNEQTSTVINNHCCSGVSLTGSLQAGKSIAQTAGNAIKKHVLELGGSDAMIVLTDANIELAAETAAISRFSNAGQICVSAKRIIVLNNIADIFIEELKTHITQLNRQSIAPMARCDLRDKLDHQVQQSIKLGAKALIGCTMDLSYASYPASLLDNVNPGMPAFDEELFGPVAVIVRAETLEDAIQLANNSCYGLAASVWTNDRNQALTISRKLDVGNVFFNSLVKSDARLPFGGTKLSGYGRELGELGIKEFTNAKTVVIN